MKKRKGSPVYSQSDALNEEPDPARMAHPGEKMELTASDVPNTDSLLPAQEPVPPPPPPFVTAQHRLAFLSEAGLILAGSLDYQTTLENLARLSVAPVVGAPGTIEGVAAPAFADWCVVDAVEEGGQLTRAVACADPAKQPLVRALKNRLVPDPGTVDGVLRVLLTGEPEFNPTLPEDWLGEPADTPETLALIRGLGLVSNLLVPLRGRGRTLGVVTFATAEGGRSYSQDDLKLAMELAQRAALALDNARLYREAQRGAEKRKEDAEARRQSDAGFRLLFAGNPHPMWVYDLETLKVLEVNAAAVAHYGYSRNEFLALRVTDLRAKEEAPSLPGKGRSAPDQAGRWRHRTKGGRTIDMEIVSHALTFAERKAALVVAQDVTERTQAEIALRQSEGRLRRLIESNIIGVVFSHFSRGVVDTNEAFLALTGYERNELLGNAVIWEALTPAEYAPLDEKATADLMTNGSCTPYEKELLRKDGDRVPVLLASALLSASEDVPYNAVSYVLDITDRKRAEDEVKAAEARHRLFVRDVLYSVSEGKLRLCDEGDELPPALELFGEESEPIPLSGEALALLRAHAREAAQTLGFEDIRGHDLVTAVGEAGMNAVVHGGGGEATVHVNHETGTVQVRITDQGAGIAVHTLPRATLERGFTTGDSLGHGFWLMLQTADRIWLRTGTDGTTVVVELDRTPPDPFWLLGQSPELP
jgi:PAS domain S-box-containing protein